MSARKSVRVWDLPTRVFHWALAATVLGSFATGFVGGNAIEWHERLGYVALALLIFRVIWGFVGSDTSRFTDFIRPSAIGTYLRSGKSPTLGHNPLGALSVLAMLFLLIVQACTGLFVDDEIATQGPLAGKVAGKWVSLATTIHRYNQWVIGAVVILHIVAILYYMRVKKEPIVKAMVTGEREVDMNAAPAPRMRASATAWIILALCGAFVYWLVVVFPKS